MKINGKVFEVTDLANFAISYITNPKNPKAGTFRPAGGIRIQLASVVQGFGLPFIPGISVKTDTAADGSFSLNITTAQLNLLKKNKMVYFVAFRKSGSISAFGQNITVYEPVYRSEPFDITKSQFSAAPKIYFAPYNVPNSAGISQSMVDQQIKEAKKKFKDISKLNATILSRDISVSGSGRGAEIKFKIDLGVSTSSNLSSFIKGKVEDLDIDLPGPDFIVGICVSKDDIAKEVDKGIAGIIKEANKTIESTLIDQVAAQTGQSKSIISTLFKNTASVTFRSLSYPVVDHKSVKIPGIKTMNIDVRAVVPKIAVGFPRFIK